MKKIVLIIIALLLIAGFFVLPKHNDLDELSHKVSGGVEYDYPKNFNTKYIKPLDWPPEARVLSQVMSCTEAGSATERAGETQKRRVGGVDTCVTTLVEGAAGSTYSQYAYAFDKGGKQIIFTFSTRAPQCGNYPDVEKMECEKERDSFSIDKYILPAIKSAEFVVAENVEGEADTSKMNLSMKTWQWVRAEYEDGRTITPRNDRFSLTFKNDATFGATTDCNGVGGNYTGTKQGGLVFSQMISTLMYCEGSQENEFKEMLTNTSSYSFTPRGELVLHLKFDSGSVIFR